MVLRQAKTKHSETSPLVRTTASRDRSFQGTNKSVAMVTGHVTKCTRSRVHADWKSETLSEWACAVNHRPVPALCYSQAGQDVTM